MPRISKPRNCRVHAERQLAFEQEINGRTVHVHITWEAALRKPTAEITRADERAAIDNVERDPHFEISRCVIEKVRAGAAGDRDHPIFIMSADLASTVSARDK